MHLIGCLLIAVGLPIVYSSYCGQSAIPFTFQVLRSGYPVLGCARPKCFGWTANGTRAGDSAQFYRVAGKDDGYLRRSDQFIRSASSNPNFVAQIAVCADNYNSKSCEEGEWVGGLSPQSDPFTDEVQIRCCSYQALISAQDRGKAIVKQGQLTVGGEYQENGKLVAFDYISNIEKQVSQNGTVTYIVTMKRMPCTSDDESVDRNLVVESAAVAQTEAPAQVTQVPTQVTLPQAFAAPTQNVQTFTAPVGQQPVGYTNIGGQQQAVYGQLSQPGYGVAQNGQYYGYPQYAQQGPQVQQVQQPGFGQLQPQQQPAFGQPQQPQQAAFGQPQQPQFYQDPLAAMIQQQQAQQAQLAQQMMFPAPVQQPAAAAPGVAAPAAAAQPVALATPPTMAPLPKFEDLPKLTIPSVEDVEQVIPPVQRAILTSVAKFFGVL